MLKLQPFDAVSIAKSGELVKMMQGLASTIPDMVLRVVAKMCLSEKEMDRPEMQDILPLLTINVDNPDSEKYQEVAFLAAVLEIGDSVEVDDDELLKELDDFENEHGLRPGS